MSRRLLWVALQRITKPPLYDHQIGRITQGSTLSETVLGPLERIINKESLRILNVTCLPTTHENMKPVSSGCIQEATLLSILNFSLSAIFTPRPTSFLNFYLSLFRSLSRACDFSSESQDMLLRARLETKTCFTEYFGLKLVEVKNGRRFSAERRKGVIYAYQAENCRSKIFHKNFFN